MKKKLLILFILMVVIGASIYAEGMVEVLTDTVVGIGRGMVSGAVVGGVAGGIGAIPGMIIGGFVGGATGLLNSADTQNEGNTSDELGYVDNYNAAKKAQSDTDAQILIDKASLSSAETSLTNYDSLISNWSETQALNNYAFNQKSDNTFSSLMDNFTGSEVIGSAKGQMGGSSALLSSIEKGKASEYAGTDLTLNAVAEGAKGGVYAKQLSANQREMADTKTSYLIAKQDLTTSLENYRASIATGNSTSILYGNTADTFKKKVNNKKTQEDITINESGDVIYS